MQWLIETRQTEKERRSKWRRWFAWHPVCIGLTKDEAYYRITWLTFVERRSDYYTSWAGGGWVRTYRKLQNLEAK